MGALRHSGRHPEPMRLTTNQRSSFISFDFVVLLSIYNKHVSQLLLNDGVIIKQIIYIRLKIFHLIQRLSARYEQCYVFIVIVNSVHRRIDIFDADDYRDNLLLFPVFKILITYVVICL